MLFIFRTRIRLTSGFQPWWRHDRTAAVGCKQVLARCSHFRPPPRYPSNRASSWDEVRKQGHANGPPPRRRRYGEVSPELSAKAEASRQPARRSSKSEGGKRRARERVGESGGEARQRAQRATRPERAGEAASERAWGCRGAKQDSERQRATRPERAGEAARERACRGVPGGEAPRTRMRPPRLERGTLGLEGRCSIQLSYGRVEALILAQSPVMNGAAGVVPWGRRDV